MAPRRGVSAGPMSAIRFGLDFLGSNGRNGPRHRSLGRGTREGREWPRLCENSRSAKTDRTLFDRTWLEREHFSPPPASSVHVADECCSLTERSTSFHTASAHSCQSVFVFECLFDVRTRTQPPRSAHFGSGAFAFVTAAAPKRQQQTLGSERAAAVCATTGAELYGDISRIRLGRGVSHRPSRSKPSK